MANVAQVARQKTTSAIASFCWRESVKTNDWPSGTDPHFTLGFCAKATRRGEEETSALPELVSGAVCAQVGTKAGFDPRTFAHRECRSSRNPDSERVELDGRDWFN
jgi:hypothetical protein